MSQVSEANVVLKGKRLYDGNGGWKRGLWLRFLSLPTNNKTILRYSIFFSFDTVSLDRIFGLSGSQVRLLEKKDRTLCNFILTKKFGLIKV
jgi:hypothetical protein